MAIKAPATSVVVSTYDDKRWPDLVACLESLQGQSAGPLETIVVVDHNPALLEKVSKAFPLVKVLANERPRGLAGARNTGAAAAQGEVIAFIDDDARAEPNWLEQLGACFGEDGVIGAGGALIPRWESSEASWIPREFYWVFGCSYTGLPEHLSPVRNPIGANMAVRASILEDVDGFREGSEENAPRELRARGMVRAAGNLPDDTDFAIRVKQRHPGAVWLYQPDAKVLHTVTPERASLDYFLRRCYEEGVGKANLSRHVGPRDGLSSERRHLATILPRGVARELGRTLKGEPSGAARAGAIVLGLLASAVGFGMARLSDRERPARPQLETASGDAPSATAELPSFSVVIAAFTFDRLPSIEKIVESLRKQTVPPAETILVIDHSDELLDECRRRWPDLKVIPNAQDPGSCGGRNTGLAESNGDVIAFLDDDAVPGHDWIERLGSAYADPRVLSVGGGVRPRWLTERPSWFPAEFLWVVGCAHSGMPKQREPVRNVIIANMSVRRDAMVEIGGLRQQFSRIEKNAAGAEETDLCIRLAARWPDGLILFDPEAAVEHYVPAERTTLGYFRSRCFAEGRSKAALSNLVGPDAGLAAERSYVRRTLPLGVLRNLRQAICGDLAGISRAAMIVFGLAMTVAGYLTAPRRGAAERDEGVGQTTSGQAIPPSPDFVPVRMDEVELSSPLPTLTRGKTKAGVPFAASLCLVRRNGKPLGLVEVDLPEDGLAPEALAARIEAELGDRAAATNRSAAIAERDRLLSDPPSLSVVICTRNRPDSVRITLRSILACPYPEERWEIVVVDNASEADPSIEAAAKEADGRIPVKVVHEPIAGLSNARNCGVRHSSGEIVVFADDDVEVDRDWLAALAAPFVSDERVGATSGLTLPGTLETPVERWTEGFGGRSRPLRVRRFDLSAPPPDNPLFPFTVGEFGAGRNMAFRRELLVELGGFDPALGPGSVAHDGDDIEALLRVLLSGHAIVNDPAAIVWHAHPDDYAELGDRVWGYGVGLTATLTKALIMRPSLIFDLARKLPRGIAFAISPSSEKNEGRQRDFPASLARRELLGMAYGPIAYIRSARHERRLERERRAAAGPSLEEDGTSPLRLLIVTDEYRPVIGGAGRNIELLARELAQNGHKVAVATAWQPEAAAEEDEGEIRIHRIRDLTSRMRWVSDDPHRHHAPPFPDPEAISALRGLVADFKPDLVHAYGWLTNSAAVALSGSEVPLLVSMHDYGNVCAQFTLVRHGEQCSGPAPAKCLACAASTYGAGKGSVAVGSLFGSRPLLRRKVSAIHSVSHFTAQATTPHLDIAGVEAEVIPNFLATDGAEPVEESILAELPDQPFILFVGHLRPYKGINVLLDAYGRLESPPPLVLVGTIGPDSPETFPPGVKAFTFVPHGTVMAMWERALFGVSPSIAPEALPSVVLEAMSKGKAMIGSRNGGYSDLIEEGETGLLSEPGDAEQLAANMALLIEDRKLRERLGEAAEGRAQLFSPNRIVPRFERLYRETVARARRDGR